MPAYQTKTTQYNLDVVVNSIENIIINGVFIEPLFLSLDLFEYYLFKTNLNLNMQFLESIFSILQRFTPETFELLKFLTLLSDKKLIFEISKFRKSSSTTIITKQIKINTASVCLSILESSDNFVLLYSLE